jgi:regulator of sirC expression with transglutaminase-like and TPR domain
MHTMDTLAELAALDDTELDLLEAALMLAALDHPGARLASFRAHLDQMTDECALIAGNTHTAIVRAEALSQCIAFDHGYTGDRANYDDPANANLIDVIDRRQGLPVAISIIYIGLCRRLEWPAAGLNHPGHFLIRIGSDDEHVIQDPFTDGRLIPTGRTIAGFDAPTAPPIDPANVLADRAVLVRLLNNLASRAEKADDLPRALEMHSRMAAIAPHYPAVWWERARLEQQMGHLSAARASLIHMLETTRDAALRIKITNRLEGLTRSVN